MAIYKRKDDLERQFAMFAKRLSGTTIYNKDFSERQITKIMSHTTMQSVQIMISQLPIAKRTNCLEGQITNRNFLLKGWPLA